jgi:hypothetical protein
LEHYKQVIDPSLFIGVRLLGGYTITAIVAIAEPLVDPLGRKAVAQTRIRGHEFAITILSNPDEKEWSVSLYHEILEAMTVALDNPPASVIDFNEATSNARAMKPTKSLAQPVPRA